MTQITAEELMEGTMTGSTASIQLKDIVGDIVTSQDVKNIFAKSGDFNSLVHHITMLRWSLKPSGRERKCRETCQSNLNVRG